MVWYRSDFQVFISIEGIFLPVFSSYSSFFDRKSILPIIPYFGERKVISNGSDGPVVEIIRKAAKETEHDSETLENSEIQELEKTSEAEMTGEEDGNN